MTAAAVVYARLRVADPERWRSAAAAWRRCADLAEQWAARVRVLAARAAAAWTGAAATAAVARLDGLRRAVLAIRLLCREAELALSDFAAGLGHARELLGRGRATAAGSGLTVDDAGVVVVPARPPYRAAPLRTAFEAAGLLLAARQATTEISAAIEIATEADSSRVTRR